MTPTGPRELAAQRRLVELEGTIQGGLDSFIAVGQALLEIRDSRLYRFASHPTFEAYAKARWNIGPSRANQLMDAAEISTMVEVPNERQSRELVPVLRDEGPEAVREVWAEVKTRTDKPTAAVVRAVVAERRPDPEVVAFRERVLAADPDMQLAELRLRWSKIALRLSELVLVKPEEFVAHLERGDLETLPGLIGSGRTWLDSIERELRAAQRPRVVGGNA